MWRRRAAFALSYSFASLALSSVPTLAGMIAALWHMAWWIAVAFAVMNLISLVLVTIAGVTRCNRHPAPPLGLATQAKALVHASVCLPLVYSDL
jgi:hypothetical protein